MASAKKILKDLIPDQNYSFLPDNVDAQRVKEYCELKRFENSDLTNLKIAVAGFGAILEVANLVMGAKDQHQGKLHPAIFGIFFIFDIQAPPEMQIWASPRS